MASVSLALPPDYWKNLSLNNEDLEFISNYLFEKETPLTEKELVPLLIEERLRGEREALANEQRAAGKAYLPKEQYKSGDNLVFPALDWAKGKVAGVRAGVNPAVGEFGVMEVEFEDGSKRAFATGLAVHKLNQPPEDAGEDGALNQSGIYREFGPDLEQRLTEKLHSDEDLVRIAGRWFPRALLVDVNMGHLNLAEAVLDEASGGPLATSSLLEQVELPANVNPKLIEFSMNFALQEDGRFDEVGPAGEVLWYLKRLEPEDVQKVPAPLRYAPIEYDRTLLSPEMLAQEAEIDDELGESEAPDTDLNEVTIALTFPHWRAGTLPVSARVHGLFPTAYESPRVRFTLVDAKTENKIPAWVVRQHRYVSGLAEYFKKYELVPGSLITLRKGKKPGQTIIEARTHRPTRDWVRTVLAGSDGGIVFAMLKQNLSADFNERMMIAVPDVEGVDEACEQLVKLRPSFDSLVHNMMVELVKLNVQGHVHVQELYSALNVIRRCPPAPLLAFLAGQSEYKHVGDMHFRLADSEGGNE
jgi:hypothetical protein